jgi:hypothetical protein
MTPDTSVELALARSLVIRMDEGDARRIWGKVATPCPVPDVAPAAEPSRFPSPSPRGWQRAGFMEIPKALSGSCGSAASGRSHRRVRRPGPLSACSSVLTRTHLTNHTSLVLCR